MKAEAEFYFYTRKSFWLYFYIAEHQNNLAEHMWIKIVTIWM